MSTDGGGRPGSRLASGRAGPTVALRSPRNCERALRVSGWSCNVHAPDREGVERKMIRQKIRQPDFELFQISKNTSIIFRKLQNNGAGEAVAILFVFIAYCF